MDYFAANKNRFSLIVSENRIKTTLIVFSVGWRIKGDLNIFISFSFLFSILSTINLHYSCNWRKSKSLKLSPYTHSNTRLRCAPDSAVSREGRFLYLIYKFGFLPSVRMEAMGEF